MRTALYALALALGVGGCGYKAPLYLAKPKGVAEKPTPSIPPAPERPVPADAVPPPK
jgi:hypothetical protein